MKIRKVDDKPMVIHTKEKAKIHAHEPKGAKIKGSNIYTVERGPKTCLLYTSVSKNKYSKCYRFQDINYTTATEDEQIGIFERYCKFLNSLDCNYKITINNKNKNMDELRDKVLIAEKNDGFNNYRRIYNDIIEEKIIEDVYKRQTLFSTSGLQQERRTE